MSKSEKMVFQDIMLWCVNNLMPGVDHVVYRGTIYWTDSSSDLQKLYELWQNDQS